MNKASILGMFALVFMIATCTPGYSQSEGDFESARNHVEKITDFAIQASKALGDHEARMLKLTAQARRLSPGAQRLFVKKLKPGEYVNVPAFWRTVNDPPTLFDALYTFNEPLTTDMIDALERNLPQIKSEPTRTHAAALLYRYGHSSGTEILAKRLRAYKKDPLAASRPMEIFVLAQDARFLPECIDAIQYKLDREGIRGTGILHRTGNWKPAAFRATLARLCAKYPEDPGLLILVAKQGVTEAIPYIESTYLKSSEARVRMIAASSLLSLDPSRRDELMPMFEKAFLKGEDTDAKWSERLAVIDGLAHTGSKDALPIVRMAIQEYLEAVPKKLPLTEENLPILIAYRNLVTLSSLAVEAIDQQRSMKDVPLLESLLLQWDKNGESSYIDDTANVLFRLSPGSPTLRRVMGNHWVKRRQAVSRLKPLPEGLDLAARSFIL